MTKENAIKKAKKYFKGKTLSSFLEQINYFYDALDPYKIKSKYKQGDEVQLDRNSLIHGSRITIEELNNIKEAGLIAPEFLKTYNKNKKKPFVIEFWKIDEAISLKDFIEKYCGVTIEVKQNTSETTKRIITPIKNIESEILKLKDYRDYIIYQNQEQRFLPNRYSSNSTMAFIVNNDNDIKNTIISKDIFDENFDSKITKSILPRWFYKKYMEKRTFDNYETGRERAILFGIPSCFIEGIIVSKEIELKQESVNKIKEIFPNCYICNIDGKVIL